MSSVDNRVVNMSFNNSNFERNVKTSLGTLEKLKSALNFGKSADGLSGLEKATRNLDLSALADSIDTIAKRFSTMGMIGMSVLNNLVNKAVSTGERIVSSLTVDQVNEGWKKYAEKTTAVQTIMAATKKNWEEQAEAMGFSGSQMEFVNDQLDKLNWFTDETSYNFTDMVNNIGKFTSQGQSLDASVTAMQGIATWAAKSGQNASTATRAMYNLAQALSVGSVKLIDWKSIENANMATVEFKEAAMDAAVEAGTLTKSVDSAGNAIYKTTKGTEVTAASFSQTLEQAWFTSDALMKVLGQYGEYASVMHDFSDETGFTASQLRQMMESMDTATASDWEKWSKKAGMSTEDFKEKLAELNSEEYEFGRSAFYAAQEAKTYQEAIDATADAASTAWMNIFETIFGDYEGAKKLWTNFANFLYDALVAPLENVQEVLDNWKDFGGQYMFIQGLEAIPEAFENIIEPAKKAWEAIFPPKSLESIGGKLAMITSKVAMFFKGFSLSNETSDKLQRTFRGLFAILDIGKNAISSLISVLRGLFPSFKDAGGGILDLTANIGDFLVHIRDVIKENHVFTKVFSGIAKIIKPIISLFTGIIGKLSDFAGGLKDLKTDADMSFLEKVGAIFETVASSIVDSFDKIGDVKAKLQPVFDFFSGLANYLSPITDGIKDFFTNLTDYLSNNKIKVGSLAELAIVFRTIFQIITHNKLGKMFDGIGGAFESLGSAIDNFTGSGAADNMKTIAVSLLIFAAAMAILASIDFDKAGQGLTILAGGLIELLGSIVAFNAFEIDGKEAKNISKLCNQLVKLSAAMILFAVAVKILSKLSLAEMGTALLGIFAGLALMVVALKALDSVNLGTAGAQILAISMALILFAAAMLILGNLDSMQIAKGITSVITGLAAMVLALMALSKVAPNAMAAAGAIFLVSAALLFMATAFAAFSAAASMESSGAGLMYMIAMLTMLIAVLWGLGAVGPATIVGASALLIASVALVAMAAALLILSMVNPDKIGESLMTFAAMAVIAGLAMVALGSAGPMVLIGAAALLVAAVAAVIASAAMVVLSTALLMLQGVDLLGTAEGLVAIGGAMIALGVAGVIMTLGAAGIILGAIGIALLAVGLSLLSGMPLGTIGDGLVAIAGGMTALGVVGALLAPFAVELGILTLAFDAFSVGALAISGAIAIIASSITSIIDSAKGFGNAVPTVVSGLKDLGTGIDNALSETASEIRDIGEYTGRAYAEGIVAGSTESVSMLISAMSEALTEFQNGKGDFALYGNQSGRLFIAGFAGGVGEGLTAATSYVTGKVAAVGAAAKSTASGYSGQFTTIGAFMMYGLANGIYTGKYSVENAVRTVCQAAIDEAMETLDENSPSKVFFGIGKFVDEGMANGLTQYSSLASNAAESMADGVIAPVSQMTDQLVAETGKIGDAINGSYNTAANLSTKITSEQDVNINHTFDTLRVEGVNNEGELVAVSDYAVEQIVTKLLRRQYRV